MKTSLFLILALVFALGLLYFEHSIEYNSDYPVIVYQNNDNEDYGSRES